MLSAAAIYALFNLFDILSSYFKIIVQLLSICNIYYSTMMSFHHIWSRERAKYETVIHCSVPV